MEIFNSEIARRRNFDPEQQALMREIYLAAVSALELVNPEERRRLARIVIRVARLANFPAPAEFTTLVVSWYGAGKAE